MPGKKIRVGVADESLTPSEQRKIEVKVDKMLAVPGVPAVSTSEIQALQDASSVADADSTPQAVKPKPEPAAKPVTVAVSEAESDGEAITVSRTPAKAAADMTADAALAAESEQPEPTVAAVPQLVRMPWREPVPTANLDTEASVADATGEGDSAGETDDAATAADKLTIGNLDDVPESHILDEVVPGGSKPASVDEPAKPTHHPGITSLGGSDELDKKPAPAQNFFVRIAKAWWLKRRWRYGTFAALVLVVGGVLALPASRAMALSVFGVRATVTLAVLDGTTKLPLEGAHVAVGGVQADTNVTGQAVLHHVKLGRQTVRVQKPAFAVAELTETISTGTNKLSPALLKPDGTLYKFSITDYLSGKAISGAKAVDGEANAVADAHGLIVLTLKAPSAGFTATISAAGYRNEQIKVDATKTAAVAVKMVPAVKDTYISNRSGTYDLRAVDIDGKNDTLLLAGTGRETADVAQAPNAAGDEVALVSTRDDQRDSGGYLLQALTFVNVRTKAAVTVEHSQHIQLIDWYGDRLVYMMTKAGASAANPSRYQLMSYDFRSAQRLQLDHANYFNDVVSADGSIYYATSNQYSGGVSEFKKIDPDGDDKQTLLVNEIWDIFRTAYDKFALSSPTGWYDYQLGAAKPTSTASVYNGSGLTYWDGTDGKSSVWLDTRDGKNTLLLHDKTTQHDTVLLTRDGMTAPVRWLDKNTVIFRVYTGSESADYALNVHGGAAKKIIDMTNATGIGRYRN